MSGGSFVTKPLRFKGDRLSINFATSAAGGMRVEIQDAAGKPIPGFALKDRPEIFGDTLHRVVTWKSAERLYSLAGKPVRLLFKLKDADLYSFQFTTHGSSSQRTAVGGSRLPGSSQARLLRSPDGHVLGCHQGGIYKLDPEKWAFEPLCTLGTAPRDWRVVDGQVYSFLGTRLVRLANVP
jgi:hypothetical protein